MDNCHLFAVDGVTPDGGIDGSLFLAEVPYRDRGINAADVVLFKLCREV